jgi:hypothetical protein
VLKINGYTRKDVGYEYPSYVPDKAVDTGGYYGINGASLSRQMLHLQGPNSNNTWGEYSQTIGGDDLRQRLQSKGESFELKVPAYVWQMKSKGDGVPASEGGDEMVLHIGSGQGIRDRIGAGASVGGTTATTTPLDGLAICFNETQQTLSLFWNGKRLWQLSPSTSAADLARLLASPDSSQSGTQLLDLLKTQANSFMEPDSGLYNNSGINTGPEVMSILGRWFNNLFTSGFYLRYQQGAFSQAGKTYQGRLIFEVANAMRYLPYEYGTFSDTPRLNSIDKGLQLSIPIEQAIQFNGTSVNLNAYGWSGGNRGVHALAGIEFNTDKPLEGLNLGNLKPVGDLNGDGYQDMIGLGSLASGWNYDYNLDLPNNNLSERGTSSDKTEENSFTLNKGANGAAISRSTLTSPVIVWGGTGNVSLDSLTPILRGSAKDFTYTDASSSLVNLDNFTAAANVLYQPLGDVNGDGFDDVAIMDTGTSGSTYVLYGGPGLRDAKSYLERFRVFFPETRAKDTTNLPIKDSESYNVYLKSNASGFGIDSNGTSNAWINAINLERSANNNSNSSQPAFGGVRVTKITGISGQQLANLSGGGDFSGDGLGDIFLTSQLSQQDPSRFVMFGTDATRSITILGTPNSDSLKGTPGNDVIVSGAGNDIIQGQGGMDAINAGPGDDQIYVNDDQFRRIDGGSGDDTIILQGQRNQGWDFTRLASGGRIRNIENLDLKDFGANTITLNAAAVRAMSPSGKLVLNGDLQTDTPECCWPAPSAMPSRLPRVTQPK